MSERKNWEIKLTEITLGFLIMAFFGALGFIVYLISLVFNLLFFILVAGVLFFFAYFIGSLVRKSGHFKWWFN